MKALLTLEIEVTEDTSIDAAYLHVGALLGAIVAVARESGAAVINAHSAVAREPDRKDDQQQAETGAGAILWARWQAAELLKVKP